MSSTTDTSRAVTLNRNLILAIETSCDETALSLLRTEPDGSLKVLGELVRSQVQMHAAYGGVVPELAAREHVKALPVMLEQLVGAARIELREITYIAVTAGPGLSGCLLTGVLFATGLATQLGIRVLGINHLEGHMLVTMLDNPGLRPPFLALIVSGGHTELVMVEKIGKYQVLSRTRDDAAGEAFDKCAALLGFSYPGGASLAALADSVNQTSFSLPRISSEITDFSFSGLKTAVSLLVKKTQAAGAITDTVKAELAHAIQKSVISVLVRKLTAARKEHGAASVVVAGGVSANASLRSALTAGENSPNSVFFPTFAHAADNAVMIGVAAAMRLQAGFVDTLREDIRPRWPLELLTSEHLGVQP